MTLWTAALDLNMKMRVFWDIVLYSCAGVDNHPDDGRSTHVWNIGLLQRDYTVLCPRRLSSSNSMLWEPQSSHGFEYVYTRMFISLSWPSLYHDLYLKAELLHFLMHSRSYMPPVSFSTDHHQRIETINSRDFYIYIQVLLLCKEWTKITITVIRVVLSFQNNKLNRN
jgi:hypothetical protein